LKSSAKLLLKDEAPMQFVHRVGSSVCNLLQAHWAGKLPKNVPYVKELIRLGSVFFIENVYMSSEFSGFGFKLAHCKNIETLEREQKLLEPCSSVILHSWNTGRR
jgi:hypothetical protein